MVHSQTIETYGHTIAGRRSFVTPGRFFCLSWWRPLYHYCHSTKTSITIRKHHFLNIIYEGNSGIGYVYAVLFRCVHPKAALDDLLSRRFDPQTNQNQPQYMAASILDS